MRLVFGLYKYFPFGGLQKDMLAIACACQARGHQVSLFCRYWAGDRPPGMEVKVLHNRAITNHGKNHRFARDFHQAVARIRPELVIGFDRIPGVDLYYAADTCFKARLYHERPWCYRLLPRYRQYVQEETLLFAPGAATHILAISAPAMAEYREFYGTEQSRFTLLPPGISRDRINSTGVRRYEIHRELELSEDNLIVLMVGSGFRTKGLDRAIAALAALPADVRNTTHLVVAGEDKRDVFLQQAVQLGVEERVHFLGGRKDVPVLMQSADVLIHPAYRENTGTVLLEAAVSCLPVIVTDVCGYASYIADNQLGLVIPSPFRQESLDRALHHALTNVEDIKTWRSNGKTFAQQADIYSMPEKAADIIERAARQKQQGARHA